MRQNIKTKEILSTLAFCLLFLVTACGNGQRDESDIVIVDSGILSEKEEQSAELERITMIYNEIWEEAAHADTVNRLQIIQNIIDRLGKNGYAAVDSENQINMTNAEQVLIFCKAVEAKEKAECTIIEVVDTDIMNAEITNTEAASAGNAAWKAEAASGFRKYDIQTENGRVDIVRGYYCFDENGSLVSEDIVSYLADLWQYTEEGYLVFEGSYYADDYYMISLTDAPEHAVFRVDPLSPECREKNRKYVQPIGYEYSNLFLVNWSEGDFGGLDFYDLFDKFYPMVYQKPLPYIASENPGIGTVYQIMENEFEDVIDAYLNVDTDMLRSKTAYFPKGKTYEYKPRGFYEISCSNTPYPEVVRCTENSDNTITLTVNAVFPYECTSKAFSHEVVIRPSEDGSFQYVSNRIIEGDCDAWWRTERLTDNEWEAVYGGHDIEESDTEESLWYLPQADRCLLTEPEKDALKSKALTAAEQVGKVYQGMEIEEGASYASNVRNFSTAQCKEVVALLGEAGFVSVTEDVNMENYQDVEAFYAEYKKGNDAMVTVLNVNRDGLIGALTFIYRRDQLQTYYVGVGWQEGGIPKIKNTLVSDLAEIKLTEKGYLIYAYEEQIVHSDACQYLRVRPLSEKCRELTRKYVAGLSFVNYSAFVTNWDSGNVEDILMPCMFEDIYRIDTGENIKVENDQIPAEVYERIMMTYFPVTKEGLRSKCGYDSGSDSYPYEMIFAIPHAPFGEVVDYTENWDGTITLFVDGVWIDYGSDHAFTSEIVVKPFPDGTFRYLSNKIQPEELEAPTVAS